MHRDVLRVVTLRYAAMDRPGTRGCVCVCVCVCEKKPERAQSHIQFDVRFFFVLVCVDLD